MRTYRIDQRTYSEIRKAINDGHKIQAIKHFRSATSSSLRDAKDAVEWIHDKMVAIGDFHPTYQASSTHAISRYGHKDIEVLGFHRLKSLTIDINKLDSGTIQFGSIGLINFDTPEGQQTMSVDEFKTYAMMSIKDQDEYAFKMLMKLYSFISAWNDGTLLEVVTE